jgi:predicted phosphoadenosine phosphosulfate sulfurtransferase
VAKNKNTYAAGEVAEAKVRKSQRDITHVEQTVLELTRERLAYIFDTFDSSLVMFSGGKDSTATLMLALEVAASNPKWHRHLPMRTIFWDEEAIPMETEEYVRRVSQRDDVALEWYAVPLKHRNACSRRSPWWWPWAPESKDLWCRELPPEARTELPGFPIWPVEARLTAPMAAGLFCPPQNGNTAMMMGIRASESLTRRRAVTKKVVDNYIVKYDEGTARNTGCHNVYPIYDWHTEDVWTAPALFGWDYNHAYDRLEMAGISHSLQRCSPAFGEEPLQKIHTYASCFPEVWAKMVDRVPGVGAAARYALTELYGYGARPERPAGMPWTEFLEHYMSKFDEPVRSGLRARVRKEIDLHYRKTSDPILEQAPHPGTGLSWDFLLMICMRGDLKERKQAGSKIQNEGGRAMPRYWHRYAEELDQILAEGRQADLLHPGRWPVSGWDLVPAYAKETRS